MYSCIKQVLVDLCPPGSHGAPGEVCMSPGDGIGTGDCPRGNGQTAKSVSNTSYCNVHCIRLPGYSGGSVIYM